MPDMWTNESVELLIDLYRSQPVLWDQTNENYKNKNLKKDAWRAIADAFGVHELEIQRKIKILATQFFREKKKIKDDSAASDTPRWFLYKRLIFLADRNEPKLEKREIHDTDQERSTDVEFCEILCSLPNEELPPDSKPECSTPSHIRRNFRNVSKRKPLNYDQRQPYIVLKELQAKKSRNRFHIFGELVAAKIEALNSSYAQNMVEHLISNILFEASTGKYDSPADTQMTSFSTNSSNTNLSIQRHSELPE